MIYKAKKEHLENKKQDDEYDYLTHASKYVAECPPAISGNGGHNATFRVACVLINGFDLNSSEAMLILNEYNQRCEPQWKEKDLEHKIEQAYKVGSDEPKGHMRKKGITYQNTQMSDPLSKDRFIRFLESCFEPNDILSICDCVRNEEGRGIPEHSGVNVKTRDEWIEKYKNVELDISRLGFPSPHGAYIRINPILQGSNGSDKDVTAYRHILVESDRLPKNKQEEILRESGLPISALIDSGGKSIHAWVRVDAKNKSEYDDLRQKIWDTLPELDLDESNKNPSRFSRLPCVIRDGSEQRLIATNIGCKDFDEWESKKLGFPPIIKLDDLFKKDLPPPKVLVEGMLECGDILNFSGGSKTKKTWSMLHLGLSVAKGSRWYGKQCVKGKVLFMNLELREIKLRDRIEKIVNNGMHGAGEWIQDFHVWNLKGHAASYEKIQPALEKKLDQEDYAMVIIDPIYMIYGGLNENDNSEMTTFLNSLGNAMHKRETALVFATHQNKMGKGSDPVNSSSGAGVFGRYPESIISIGPSMKKEDNGNIRVDYVVRNFPELPPHFIHWSNERYIHDVEPIRRVSFKLKSE